MQILNEIYHFYFKFKMYFYESLTDYVLLKENYKAFICFSLFKQQYINHRKSEYVEISF